MHELDGKVAVVTGAASGIGLALAERFAAEGMKLALADIEADALAAAAERLAGSDTEVLAVPTDTSQAESVDALAERTLDHFGAVHVVCNNAGVGGHGFSTWAGPQTEWEWVLGVNLWGVVNGIRAFVPHLVDQNEGHVVNTSSLAGLGAAPFMAPYSASKHAVLGLSESLFYELALSGSAVKVSVLCPGFVRTRIAESDRNWLEHLGPAPENESPAGELMRQLAHDAIAAGVAPAEAATRVLDAIRTDRFMVLTDEHLARSSLENRRAEVEGKNPSPPGLM